MDVKGKKVTVIGMGKSGLSAATLLSQKGAIPLLIDDQQQKPPLALPSRIQVKLGAWDERDLCEADLIVLSPGVPISKLPMALLKSSNVPVISEIELASSFISSPLIGITGTNGKSTTTTLVGQILHNWGLTTFVGGNLGLPLSEAVSSHWDFIVAELSSFQLETITHFRPRIAALLNITPDHLDRYKDLDAYQKTKWRIFENQQKEDHAVCNFDDPLTLPPSTKGEVIFFSKNKRVERGVYLRNDMIQSTIWGEEESVCHVKDLGKGAAYYIENILAATAITQLCGCSLEGIAKTLRSYQGLPHRMEFVRSVSGVQYLNDSKGTNTGALMRSLEGQNKPVILIAGGRDKATDFSPLKTTIRDKVKHLILFGEAREKMARCFSDHPSIEMIQSTNGFEALETAVTRATKTANPGETILLSPACASFDLFLNYQERGETFKKIVNGLS